MKLKFRAVFLKVLIIFLALFFLLSNSFAQGVPPSQGNGGASPAFGPEPPPGGGGAAPLDSNAIYVLLAGGFLFFMFANRKKILSSIVKTNN